MGLDWGKMHDVILKLFLLITRRQKEILFKNKITKISSSRRLSVTNVIVSFQVSV